MWANYERFLPSNAERFCGCWDGGIESADALVLQKVSALRGAPRFIGVGSGVGWMRTSPDLEAAVHRTFRGPS